MMMVKCAGLSKAFATLALLLLVCCSLVVDAAAVYDKRGHHPSTQQQQRKARADRCRGNLRHHKNEARQFCLAYLHGRKPSSGTVATLPASTTTVTTTPRTTVFTSTTTVQFTEPDVKTTTTTTTTSIVTVPAPVRRRRSDAEQTEVAASLQERGHHPHPSTLWKYYPAEVITDACLLFLYGRLDGASGTTQLPESRTTVTAATSTISTLSTTVKTNPPTTTSVSTSVSTTVTSTTAVALPTPSIKSPGFEDISPSMPNSGPWTFGRGASVVDDHDDAFEGNRFATLVFANENSSPQVRQTVDNFILQRRYTITFNRRIAAAAGNTGGSFCSFQLNIGGNDATYAESFTTASGGYGQRSLTLTATATSMPIYFTLSCGGSVKACYPYCNG